MISYIFPKCCKTLQNISKVFLSSVLLFALVSLGSATIFGQEDQSYKYHIGTSAPGSGWQDPGFNDSFWSDGHGSIGYGDDDDTIVTGVTPSVYIRYDLDIDSSLLSSTIGLIINANFDDGYIAYLNGKEIIRVNMDTTSNPDNLKTTIRSNEAQLGLYVRLEGYYMDSSVLKNCNLDTINILAFEVHNDSINGSDLTFSFNYTTHTIDTLLYYNYWSDNYTRQIRLDSIDLPIVVIETDEYGYDFYDRRQATMGIINNGFGMFNKLSDAYNDYNGLITIEGRGHTSAASPKVSFRFELIDSTGENNNTKIMGLPEENDFILYGPLADLSLIHNELAFTFGRNMGYYEPRTRFCEVIINGRDMGLYVLTEKIKRDKNRVDIAKLSNEDNSGVDVTGGYIFKWDKMYPDIEVVYPSLEDITSEQEEYIYGYLNQLNEVLYSNDFTNPYTGYSRYLDIESLADYIIINELTKNIDAYYYSCYMYKDRDDRGGLIQYGPLWDYDFAMGYNLWFDIETTGWQFDDPGKPPKIQLDRILQDTSFVKMLAERWHNYRQDLLKSDSINSIIDYLVDTLRPDIDRNYEIWPVMGRLYSGRGIYYVGNTYDEEISNLKNWLIARSGWIDDNIGEIYKPLVYYSGLNDLFAGKNVAHCYPNPFTDYINLFVDIDIPGSVKLEVYDISGRVCKIVEYSNVHSGKSDFIIDMTEIQEAGMYIIKVSKDNIPVVSQHIVKME